MRRYFLFLIVALAGSTLTGPASAEDATSNKLVGTWKLVSAKYGGTQSELTKESTTVKHFTPTHFMWASYDKTGKVTRTAGGTYRFDGKTMEDTPVYGMGSDFDVVRGKVQTYQCRVEGKTLYQSGKLSNGLALEEVWELVGKM